MSPVQPVVLNGTRGVLTGVFYAPAGGVAAQGGMLVVPAFAEEMHRCRAMVALQAQRNALLGIGTLVLDPCGTGESAGDFQDADWAQWLTDMQLGVAWLDAHAGGCQALLALRTGASMAFELCARQPGIRQVVLWQPVFDVKAFFTQFLRIRVAAELENNAGIKSTEDLRGMAAAGDPIEISGYMLSPALVRDMDTRPAPDAAAIRQVRISWFETLAAEDSPVPRSSVKARDKLQADGLEIEFRTVIGPPFWHLHERTLAPALLEATTARLRELIAAAQFASPRSAPTAAPVEPDTAQLAEIPRVIACGEDRLFSILHRSQPGARRGVVIVVAGGPQYRAGAHRQFVALARRLAASGTPVLRFDLRGMGDSSGAYVGFEQSKPDLRAAVDALVAAHPGMREVVLMGECESATGILFYAHSDPRIAGAVLVNPWVRTEEGRAAVVLKNYYLGRLLSGEFWKKVRKGEFQIGSSLRSMLEQLVLFRRGRKLARQTHKADSDAEEAALPLPVRTALGMRRFQGQILLIMSGKDFIAREFDEVVKSSASWQGLLDSPRVHRLDMPDADHTFSREVLKVEVAGRISDWLTKW